MLSNQQRVRIYRGALELVEDSWGKREFYDVVTGAVCLAGAIDRTTQADTELALGARWSRTNASLEIQEELVSIIHARSPWTRFVLSQHGVTSRYKMADGGLAGIEVWNDAKMRRKSQVMALLRERIEHYEPLAKNERIAQLEAKVTRLERKVRHLTDEVSDLRERVNQLERENRFFAAARMKYTASDLRNKNDVLAGLDDELEGAYAELTAARA